MKISAINSSLKLNNQSFERKKSKETNPLLNDKKVKVPSNVLYAMKMMALAGMMSTVAMNTSCDKSAYDDPMTNPTEIRGGGVYDPLPGVIGPAVGNEDFTKSPVQNSMWSMISTLELFSSPYEGDKNPKSYSLEAGDIKKFDLHDDVGQRTEYYTFNEDESTPDTSVYYIQKIYDDGT